jgi:hypothetical protein
MPRSERCRIRGNYTNATPGHARGQAPAAGRAPGAGRAAQASSAHRAGASRRTGLSPSGDRWRVWGAAESGQEAPWRGHGRATRPSWEDDRGRAGSAPPGGWDGPRGLWSKPNRPLRRLGADHERSPNVGNQWTFAPRRPCKVGVRAGLDIVCRATPPRDVERVGRHLVTEAAARRSLI